MRSCDQANQLKTRFRSCWGTMFLVLLTGSSAVGDSIRIREQAIVSGDDITLGEISDLQGDNAVALSRMILGSLENIQKKVIQLHDVRHALTERGINWGKTTLSGFASCQVHRKRVKKEERIELDTAKPMYVESQIYGETLHGQVINEPTNRAARQLQDLCSTFSDRDERALQKRLGQARFEVEPLAAKSDEKIPPTIMHHDGSRIADSYSATAEVKQRLMALVTTRTIGRGALITEDSIQLRPTLFKGDRGQPLVDPEVVLGRRAAAILRPGTVIYPRHLRLEKIVARGDRIDVQWTGNGLVLRTLATARQDGSLGQRILVRSQGSRQEYLVTVTGPGRGAIGPDGASSTMITAHVQGNY